VIAKAVVLEETATFKPTSRKLNMHEEVRRIAKSVECLKLKHDDPNGREDSEPESHDIPSIPVHLCAYL
jgi:hypothetical protein